MTTYKTLGRQISRVAVIWSSTLILAGHTAQAGVTIEFLAPPSLWNTSETNLNFRVKTTGGKVSGVQCWISSLSPDRGDPARRDSLVCAAVDKTVGGSGGILSITRSPNVALKPGPYGATLQVLGLEDSGSAVSQTVAFRAIVPAVTLKVGETDPLRIPMTRPWPFSTTEVVIPVGIRSTGDLAPKLLPEVALTPLYAQNGESKDIVTGGYLTAYFCASMAPCARQNVPAATAGVWGLEGKLFQVDAVVPPGVQKPTGLLRLRSPEFASDVETPVTLVVKDGWYCAAIVVFLGQALSFLVNQWITVGRQKKLNKSELAALETRLLALLLSRPDLDSRKEIAETTTLLSLAEHSNKLAEVESARKTIVEAKDKLDKFIIHPPPDQPTTVKPEIVLLQKTRACRGRRISFVLMNPKAEWGNAVYKWERSGKVTWLEAWSRAELKGLKAIVKERQDQSQWLIVNEAEGLRTIARTFWRTGQYVLRVSIDGNQVASTEFRLESDQSSGLLEPIARWDKAILLLAVVFAAMLAYLAIDKLETFGSVSDYALAFLGGFGLNATTSGFSAVISRFNAVPS